VIIDTPGQIEIFTWSASGAIITDAVASALPTVIAYIVDTPRTVAPATFMSNMLYACRYVIIPASFRHVEIGVSLDLQPYSAHFPYSEYDSCSLLSILYKTKLPFIIVFNKTDVQPHDFALEWMQDFEVFQEALASHQSTTDDDGEPTYMNSLMNSMSLVLDEFYKHLKVGPRNFPFSLQTSLSQSVGVSSMTGDGVAEFFQAVEASREEYERYIPLCLFLLLVI
jgi:hypothetical protein